MGARAKLGLGCRPLELGGGRGAIFAGDRGLRESPRRVLAGRSGVRARGARCAAAARVASGPRIRAQHRRCIDAHGSESARARWSSFAARRTVRRTLTIFARPLAIFASLSFVAACAVTPADGSIVGAGDDALGADEAASADDTGSLDPASDATPLPSDAALAPDAATPPDTSATPPVDAGAPPPPTANGVTIIVEPNGKSGMELVNAINGAKKSVHMTMYILSDVDVIAALINRHKAGVEVKVVLNKTFPSAGTDNTSVYNQLVAAKVPVVWASSTFTYTHEKCVILDGTTAWIMTMNAANTAPVDNREYLAVDGDAADVVEAEQIFAADYAQTKITPSGKLLVAPVNARPGLVSLIGSATKTLDLEGEEFSDGTIATAIAQAAQRGVKVRIVLANDTSNTTGNTAVATVKKAGAKVVYSGGTSSSSTATKPYIHAKTLVVDGARAYVGSENFSTGSLLYNRELGVIFAVASEVAKITSTINVDFAAGTAL
jgi:phosphatidylserine/phosphatidylglycerophosphate/cardiolipin synthase-like enzyme